MKLRIGDIYSIKKAENGYICMPKELSLSQKNHINGGVSMTKPTVPTPQTAQKETSKFHVPKVHPQKQWGGKLSAPGKYKGNESAAKKAWNKFF